MREVRKLRPGDFGRERPPAIIRPVHIEKRDRRFLRLPKIYYQWRTMSLTLVSFLHTKDRDDGNRDTVTKTLNSDCGCNSSCITTWCERNETKDTAKERRACNVKLDHCVCEL